MRLDHIVVAGSGCASWLMSIDADGVVVEVAGSRFEEAVVARPASWSVGRQTASLRLFLLRAVPHSCP